MGNEDEYVPQENEVIQGVEYHEEYSATVVCMHCDYSGLMRGFVNPVDTRNILFLCPECNGIERVRNIFG